MRKPWVFSLRGGPSTISRMIPICIKPLKQRELFTSGISEYLGLIVGLAGFQIVHGPWSKPFILENPSPRECGLEDFTIAPPLLGWRKTPRGGRQPKGVRQSREARGMAEQVGDALLACSSEP